MKKRFSIKAWIISWAAIGMAGVMIPAATVLIKVTNPGKTVNQQETKVPPQPKKLKIKQIFQLINHQLDQKKILTII
ncbi:hypothetical protein [Mycoplasma amphoriforme]|uniref:hypothetical protein n=1 Tax=Mycoplasma amphoriforme TaxID=273136 RepID=UPI0031BBBC6F